MLLYLALILKYCDLGLQAETNHECFKLHPYLISLKSNALQFRNAVQP